MIEFILNNESIATDLSPGLLTLDYLRHHRRLIGTKEGCKEGDCGACVVLIGELIDGVLKYKPVTSCLMPLGELHGKHLVTIEGINLIDLSPVQQAIMDEGATQCGFCTPGIVVSLTGFLMQDDLEINLENIKMALSGHLCRCTGYHSLKNSVSHLQKAVGQKTGLNILLEKKFIPDYFATIPERLIAISPAITKASGTHPVFTIAGGTDLYVQKGHLIPDTDIEVLNLRPDLKGIQQENGHYRVGALTTFEEFADNELIQKLLPDIKAYMKVIASWQIRNRATIGGNIINASPIADMTIMLLALDASLILLDKENQRAIPLKNFYKGYKQLDKSPTEILKDIQIPTIRENCNFSFEKVAKRKHLDIASVNSALKIQVEKGSIKAVSLAVGGVAPVPFLARETGNFLTDKPLNLLTIKSALIELDKEITPISDIRGSAEYKRLLARQLTIAHFTKLFPDKLKVRDFYETH